MKRCLKVGCALVFIACGANDADDYNVAYTSTMVLAEPGTAVPQHCDQVGLILIPERDVSIVDRLSGAHLEVFFRSLDIQASKLGANYLVPIDSPDAHTAAVTGAEFQAKLFSCPL